MQRKKGSSVSITHLNKSSPSYTSAGNDKKKRTSASGQAAFIILQVLFIFVGLAVFFTARSDQKNHVDVDANANLSRSSSIHDAEVEIQSLKKQLRAAKAHDNDNNLRRAEAPQQQKEDGSKYKKLEEKEKVEEMQLKELRKQVQLMSKRMVIEHFGEGPYKIEFKLDFPIDDGQHDTFVVELAPLDLMPHAVYYFLEQVRLKLLDGTSFHRNAGHVVQAGPAAPYKPIPSNPNPRQRYNKASFTAIAFQEYSAQFPHVKYTIGLAGRPGGPDWYVSTVDNTRNHGPGGQGSYAVKDEADPCFGKVIEGFNVIDRLLQQPVKPGGYRAMKQNVAIVYAKLLQN